MQNSAVMNVGKDMPKKEKHSYQMAMCKKPSKYCKHFDFETIDNFFDEHYELYPDSKHDYWDEIRHWEADYCIKCEHRK